MDPRRELARTARLLHRLGFAPGLGGNLTLRLGQTILATPSGCHKGLVRPDDLIEVDLAGRVVAGPARPTSELPMHLAVYRARPEAGAVIHAHPPLLTALTLAGIDLGRPLLPEAVATLGSVPVAPYARPGGPAMAAAIEPFLRDHRALLLDRHGCLAYGPDLTSALAKVEELEHLAKVLLAARLAGRVRTLSPAQAEELTALGRSLGLID